MKRVIKKCAIGVILALGLTLSPGALRTSPEAQRKMAIWEDCRNTPYYCTADVLTVGIGSTGGVENRTYSDAEIARRWVNDLQHAENCINQHFEGEHMPQSAFEAMTDAGLNVGCTGLMWFTNRQGRKQRTTLWQRAQTHQWKAMCYRLTDFVNSAGRRNPSLVNRRKDFRIWCLRDTRAAP